MKLFEWFDKGHAQLALEVGMISAQEFNRFIHYKRYLDVRPDCKNQKEAICILALEFDTAESTIYKAIALFEREKRYF